MDYITHPTLTDYIYRRIDNSEPLRETEIKEIMRQLFDVIRFLHSKRLCHRDVKPDNILFNRPQGKIWLIDFGVSKIMLERNVPKVMMTNTGTCEYKAPEIYEGGKYTESIDLWAAGVVLFEMVERQLPFSREYLSDVIQCIMDVDYECGEVWLELSKHAKDLLGRLLKPAAKRLTAEEALESLWFTEGDRN
jgi:calcium-dependent protein kinase